LLPLVPAVAGEPAGAPGVVVAAAPPAIVPAGEALARMNPPLDCDGVDGAGVAAAAPAPPAPLDACRHPAIVTVRAASAD